MSTPALDRAAPGAPDPSTCHARLSAAFPAARTLADAGPSGPAAAQRDTPKAGASRAVAPGSGVAGAAVALTGWTAMASAWAGVAGAAVALCGARAKVSAWAGGAGAAVASPVPADMIPPSRGPGDAGAPEPGPIADLLPSSLASWGQDLAAPGLAASDHVAPGLDDVRMAALGLSDMGVLPLLGLPDFAAPWAFLLLPLPLLALRYGPRARAEGGALEAPETVRARAAGSGGAGLARAADRLLPWLAWVALVAALAGPRTLAATAAVPPSGRDLILAVDVSGSMEREDFLEGGVPARRIDVVRRLGAAFVRGRAGDRVGLVVFGDQALFAAAPSFDVEAVAQAFEATTIGVAGRSTAISDGLGLALKRLATSTAPSRVVILLSDGSNTAGSVAPTSAAALAAELGVRVHTIALGPQAIGEGARDRNAVDDVTLARIAEASGGAAFRVRDGEDFAAVDAALDQLETVAMDAPPAAFWRDLWTWPAAVAFGAALLALAGRGRT